MLLLIFNIPIPNFVQKGCLLVGFLTIIQHSYSQYKPEAYIQAGYHYGFIGNFYKGVRHLSNQHVPGVELEYFKYTKGKKEWEQEYNFPVVTYSAFAHFYDPNKPVGNSVALLMNVGKHFIKRSKWDWHFKIGMGFSYNDKIFDSRSNNKNNMISSHINFALRASTGIHYKIGKRWLVGLGLEVVHFSNGGTRMPNMGINIPAAFVHVGYRISNGSDSLLSRSQRKKVQRSHHVHIHPSFGIKHIYSGNDQRYFVGILSGYYEYRLNRKSALNAGIDFSYDFSKYKSIEVLNRTNDQIASNAMQISILLGHELYINHFSLFTQLGIHVWDPLKLDLPVFQKAGLKCYFTEKMYASIILKVYGGAADWVETGIGYKF